MDERLERYAELVVRVGINVQPGQEVFLTRPSSTTSWRRAPRVVGGHTSPASNPGCGACQCQRPGWSSFIGRS
jgi:hypothetical protein